MLTFTFTLTVFPSTCLGLGYCYCVSLYFFIFIFTICTLSRCGLSTWIKVLIDWLIDWLIGSHYGEMWRHSSQNREYKSCRNATRREPSDGPVWRTQKFGKFWRARFRRYACVKTDIQTYIHTGRLTHYLAPPPPLLPGAGARRYRSICPARGAFSSKPAARCSGCRTMGQTEGRTDAETERSIRCTSLLTDNLANTLSLNF